MNIFNPNKESSVKKVWNEGYEAGQKATKLDSLVRGHKEPKWSIFLAGYWEGYAIFKDIKKN